jgi:hypothetical protein
MDARWQLKLKLKLKFELTYKRGRDRGKDALFCTSVPSTDTTPPVRPAPQVKLSQVKLLLTKTMAGLASQAQSQGVNSICALFSFQPLLMSVSQSVSASSLYFK